MSTAGARSENDTVVAITELLVSTDDYDSVILAQLIAGSNRTTVKALGGHLTYCMIDYLGPLQG